LKAHTISLYLQNVLTDFHDFGTLKRRFILNTSIYSMNLKFITQSGATCRKLITRTPL